MKTLATLVPLACLVAAAAEEEFAVPADRPAEGTRRSDFSVLATPLGFTCELQGIYLTRSIEMVEDETDTSTSGTNVTGRTKVSITITDTEEDWKSKKDVVSGDRRKRNSWQVSADGGAGLKWGKWGLVPNASFSLGGNVSWADDSEIRESREEEEFSKTGGSDTTLLSGEVDQSVETDDGHQKKVVTRRGDYKLVLSVRLRNTDTTDTLVVDLSQATAKIKGPGLTGVLSVPCCEKKTIELSAKPTDCKFELVIKEESQRNELLRLRAEGALSLLRLDVSGADFPVVSEKTGKNVLAEQANREQRRPGTRIAVEFGRLQNFSPWYVSKYHTAESGTRGMPVTLREALLSVEGAACKQSDSLPETVFSFSKDGTLRQVIDRPLLEKTGPEDYRMFAVRLAKEKNGVEETEVRLPLAPIMERRVDDCSEIALIEFSFSEFARAAVLSPDYFAPLRKEIEDYLIKVFSTSTDVTALSVWENRFDDAQRKDDDSPLPDNSETITALDVKRYRQRAEAGVPNMQYKLAACLFGGYCVEKNVNEAVEWCQKAAEQENAIAQTLLGICYDGEVTTNYAEAVKWFQKASEQGNATAQTRLGLSYCNGQGIETNTTEAVKWFRKAAEQGHAGAQLYFGQCYASGTGVKTNSTEAVKWFRKAAEQRVVTAQFLLGWSYLNGDGVEQNMVEAGNWFRKAAEQSVSTAQTVLDIYYEKDNVNDSQRAISLAQYFLGILYDTGKGVKKNKTKAFDWFRKAAQQGLPEAQFRLGLCYEKGEGVPRNRQTAVKWFRKAAKQGNEAAQNVLKILER